MHIYTYTCISYIYICFWLKVYTGHLDCLRLAASQFLAMAPKRNAKRKAPDVVAASSAQQAPAVAEPVMPDLASLPEADATILGQVLSLGHYPKSLDAKGQKKASPERIDERCFLRRLER